VKNVIIIKVMKEDVREATMVKDQLEGQKVAQTEENKP
jgi:hypothetical protein